MSKDLLVWIDKRNELDKNVSKQESHNTQKIYFLLFDLDIEIM